MTLAGFQASSLNDQAAYLWSFRPLDERRTADHTILLYSTPVFYAEVHYHALDNRIVSISAFTEIRHLSPYFK